jgi:hypothetical protein
MLTLGFHLTRVNLGPRSMLQHSRSSFFLPVWSSKQTVTAQSSYHSCSSYSSTTKHELSRQYRVIRECMPQTSSLFTGTTQDSLIHSEMLETKGSATSPTITCKPTRSQLIPGLAEHLPAYLYTPLRALSLCHPQSASLLVTHHLINQMHPNATPHQSMVHAFHPENHLWQDNT